MATLEAKDLSDGWEFSQAGSNEWLPVARVPTNIHLDLIANKM
jgi:beta-mannosidase